MSFLYHPDITFVPYHLCPVCGALVPMDSVNVVSEANEETIGGLSILRGYSYDVYLVFDCDCGCSWAGICSNRKD